MHHRAHVIDVFRRSSFVFRFRFSSFQETTRALGRTRRAAT
jgi:hypothetical protein